MHVLDLPAADAAVLTPSAPPATSAPAGPPRCHVHKFGGSSLADANLYRTAMARLDDGAVSCVVVVSAMGGVTNALLELVATARAGGEVLPAWTALRQRHLDAADALDPQHALDLHERLHEDFAELLQQLGRIVAGAALDAREARALSGLGELYSSRLLHAALTLREPAREHRDWARLDAREVLVVHEGELGMSVDWAASGERLAHWRAAHPARHVVVTGYLARDPDGRPTTLGRNGSDYSAAIFARLFAADALTIWTDVDGVLSADPRRVPDAVCLPAMSYAEACELAYFGAKVLHPQTLAPVIGMGLPVRIRNTRNPDAPGTLIGPVRGGDAPVQGLSLVESMAVLELTGAGLIGVPGTAERMFAALHRAGVSVTMISQGSSEHSICCLLRADQAEAARAAVARAFADECAAGQVEGVRVDAGVAVLAAVGDGMVGRPGVAARLFAGLAQARVNVRAIAQGASERSISVAVAADEATRALRAAHSAFWLSPQTVSVGLIGPGNVGRALLRQFAEALPRLAAQGRIDLRLRALANRRQMLLADTQLEPGDAAARLAAGDPLDLDAFAAHLRAGHLPHALIIDCSGSDAIAAQYPRWLAAGIHVVTPSKHAGSGPLDRLDAIRAAQRGGAQFRYEASVGAGLPVIQTLRSMLDTGDVLDGVEGVLSGTLAWLFNRYDGSQPFSALVGQARALGYTEPDPRDDLSGLDVARKLVILAREAGSELSLADVAVESLVPAALRELPLDAFLARLDELDAPMAARLDEARRDGRQLRYLARLDHTGARVGLVAPAPDHPSLHTRLTDNVIAFRTRRYADNPLVVQGPGAGPEVTAAGVFGDVLAIAQSLGLRL